MKMKRLLLILASLALASTASISYADMKIKTDCSHNGCFVYFKHQVTLINHLGIPIDYRKANSKITPAQGRLFAGAKTVMKSSNTVEYYERGNPLIKANLIIDYAVNGQHCSIEFPSYRRPNDLATHCEKAKLLSCTNVLTLASNVVSYNSATGSCHFNVTLAAKKHH